MGKDVNLGLRDTPLNVAVLEGRPEHRERLRYFLLKSRCESVLFASSTQEIINALNNEKCNSLIINIEFAGPTDSLALIQFMREQHAAFPICVIDNFARLLGDNYPNWRDRLNHYYRIPFDADKDFVGECVELTARLFRFYLRSIKADVQLRDLRAYLSSEELQLSSSSRNHIVALFLDVAEELVRSEQRLIELQQARASSQVPQDSIPHSELAAPQKVTIPWLLKHVPVQLWCGAVIALVGIFLIGHKSAGSTIVQSILDLFTKKS